MSQEECPCGMSHEWTSTDIILHLWYLIMLFFFSLFFFPLHLLYSIMPFFPPLFFSGLYWLTHHRASLGPNALTNFVSVFTEFTALKITGEEYAQRTRKIIPADHLFLVDKYLASHAIFLWCLSYQCLQTCWCFSTRSFVARGDNVRNRQARKKGRPFQDLHTRSL